MIGHSYYLRNAASIPRLYIYLCSIESLHAAYKETLLFKCWLVPAIADHDATHFDKNHLFIQ